MKYFKLFYSLSFCLLFSKTFGRSLADIREPGMEAPPFEEREGFPRPSFEERRTNIQHSPERPKFDQPEPYREVRPSFDEPKPIERVPERPEFGRDMRPSFEGSRPMERFPERPKFDQPEPYREVRPSFDEPKPMQRFPERPEFGRDERRFEGEGMRPESTTRLSGVNGKSGEEEVVTLISEDEGNWLKKKGWWEQAQALFEKLLFFNNQITSLQVAIIKGREASSKRLDELFRNFGKEQEKIRSELQYLTNLIETAKNEDLLEDFSEHEKEILNKISMSEEEFKKMIEFFDEIESREDLLSKSIIQLNQLVEECKNYEKHSWLNLKEIGQILNDEKAKTLYYGIDADFKNVESLLNYIKTELRNFIRDSEAAIQENANNIIQKLTEFEAKDLSLDKVIAEYKKAWQERQKLKETHDKKKKEILEKKKSKTINKGMFEGALDWVKSWF